MGVGRGGGGRVSGCGVGGVIGWVVVGWGWVPVGVVGWVVVVWGGWGW